MSLGRTNKAPAGAHRDRDERAVANPFVRATSEPRLATYLAGTLLSPLDGGPARYGQRCVRLHGGKHAAKDQRARFAVASRIAAMIGWTTGVHDVSATLVPGRFTRTFADFRLLLLAAAKALESAITKT
jgi:hypothetical protein